MIGEKEKLRKKIEWLEGGRMIVERDGTVKDEESEWEMKRDGERGDRRE